MEVIGVKDKGLTFHWLALLNTRLQLGSAATLDHQTLLNELSDILVQCGHLTTLPPPASSSSKSQSKVSLPIIDPNHRSNNLFKLLSRNLVLVFEHVPTRLYDFANALLNNLVVPLDTSTLPALMVASTIILTDLFTAFPHPLASLVGFAANLVYKILKKHPSLSAMLVSLLIAVTNNATKADINQKLLDKISRLASRNVVEPTVFYDALAPAANDDSKACSVLIKRNYILLLKNILIVSVLAHYESLLSQSAAPGSKLLPDSVMSNQHQWQTKLLEENQKTLAHCLSNYSQDVRVAAIELLANLLLNFVPTGKFNALDTLLDLYQLPNISPLEAKLVGLRVLDRTASSATDAPAAINANTQALLMQSSIIHSMILYIQLEQFQNPGFVANNFSSIVDSILIKFADLATGQESCISQTWYKILSQWEYLVEYIATELGENGQDQLMTYILAKFDTHRPADIDEKSESRSSVSKKRESAFFKGNSTQAKLLNGSKIDPFFNSFQARLLLVLVKQALPLGVSEGGFVTQGEDLAQVSSTREVPALGSIGLFIKNVLLKLLVNVSSHTRNCALETLVVYSSHAEVGKNQLLGYMFTKVLNVIKQMLPDREDAALAEVGPHNIVQSSSVKLLQYSLVLLALISHSNLLDLQNTLVVKILSFCTQSLKHGNSQERVLSLKNTACWIILSSLVTLYNESEFVRLNSSQLQVLWKGLLSSLFISTRINENTTPQFELAEIVNNLKVRNASLMCLSNYIKSAALSPDLLKQMQFLLVKSYNYLTTLESRLDKSGPLADFRSINEVHVGSILVHNLMFTNYADEQEISALQGITTSLIWSAKITVLQSFAKLAQLVKSDINSNMVIFLARVFGDTKTFARPSSASGSNSKQSRSKKTLGKIPDFDSNMILLASDDNLSFGVASKYSGVSSEIDQLAMRSAHAGEDEGDPLSRQFSAQRKALGGIKTWIDTLEAITFAPVHFSIHYDPTVLISRPYSRNHFVAPPLINTMVDVSIELFQTWFPHLSLQIQVSLLEQIRLSLTASDLDTLRVEAATINTAIALHGVVENFSKNGIELSTELGPMILDILNLPIKLNRYLIPIRADSVGLLSTLIPKEQIINMVEALVAQIVGLLDPHVRGSNVLCLSRIFKESGIMFSQIYNVVSQLLSDPNPVLYHHVLEATCAILDSHPDAATQLTDVVLRLFANHLNDEFDHTQGPSVWINLATQFPIVSPLATLLKLFVTRMGPGIVTLPLQSKSGLQCMIVALSYGIGAVTVREHAQVSKEVISLFCEVIIYDAEFIDNQKDFFCSLLEFVILNNMKITLASPSPTSLEREAIFPFVSCDSLYRIAYRCYADLFKIYGSSLLSKNAISMLWISLNIKPCPELKHLLEFWMEDSLMSNWFATLTSILKSSRKRIIGPFLESNYLQKLLPLIQRHKKRNGSPMAFVDEESEGIVAPDALGQVKTEPISYEVRLFIYELLNKLLTLAHNNESLKTSLLSNITEIINICFLGSTAGQCELKMQGMTLLDTALQLFGDLKDPAFPELLVLEQEQAQIISALMPCFGVESSARVIVCAIHTSSTFLNLPNLKLYSKRRILSTLTYLLEEISANKFLTFDFLETYSEYDRKLIQLAILDCWALLRINSKVSGVEIDSDLLASFEKYSELLTSLWILMLREFSAAKFNESNPGEYEIYGAYWINFIRVLTMELKENSLLISEHLGDEAGDFFFVLFTQCIEAMMKKTMVQDVLKCMDSLAQDLCLVDHLFEDEIFAEIVDLFDRYLLVDENLGTKCSLVSVVASVFHSYYMSHNEEIEQGFDKLFELIRVAMLPLFHLLPFLRSDFDDNYDSLLALSKDSINLVTLVFDKAIKMMTHFPGVVKADMYSCVLFMFAKIYRSKNQQLIASILPHMTQIVSECGDIDAQLLQTFSDVVNAGDVGDANIFILTSVLLITSGKVTLHDATSKKVAATLVDQIGSDQRLSIQCVRKLASMPEPRPLCLKEFTEKAVLDLNQELASDDQNKNHKALFEALVIVLNLFGPDSCVELLSVLVPLLLKYEHSGNKQVASFVKEKLLVLMQKDPTIFKEIVAHRLTDTQRSAAERLIRSEEYQDVVGNGEVGIELKTFGDTE